jgi:hypothetical protein
MPKNLQKITAASPKNVEVSGVRVACQSLLNLQCKAVHAAAHVGRPSRQPDPHTRGDRDHPRNAVNTRRNAARLTSLPTRTWRPSPSSISIRPERDGGRAAADEDPSSRWGRPALEGGAASCICTGTKTANSGATRRPSRTWRRQLNTRLSQTPCRAATSLTRAPGSWGLAYDLELLLNSPVSPPFPTGDDLDHTIHRHTSSDTLTSALRCQPEKD